MFVSWCAIMSIMFYVNGCATLFMRVPPLPFVNNFRSTLLTLDQLFRFLGSSLETLIKF